MLAAFLVTIFCLLSGNYIKESYDISVDKVSTKKFIAPRDIVDTVATQRKIDAARDSVTPLYTNDSGVLDKVNGKIKNFFNELDTLLNNPLYVGGIINNFIENADDQSSSDLQNIMNKAQENAYKSLSYESKSSLKKGLIRITTELFAEGVKDDGDPRSLLYLRELISKEEWSQDIKDLSYSVITYYLEPNMIVDIEATEAAKSNKASEVSPVMIIKNQKIVDEGEIITEEIYEVLNALGFIDQQSKEDIIPIFGTIILVVLAIAATLAYMIIFYKKIFQDKKEAFILCLLYCASIIFVRLFDSMTFYLIPLPMIVILASILVESRFAIATNTAVVLVSALIYNGGIDFIIFFYIIGTVSALSARYLFERSKIVYVGLLIGVVGAISAAACTLMFEKSVTYSLVINPMTAFANGVFSLIFALGSLPVWEALFDVVTPVKLADLTNPNKTLLRKLSLEAPGTYHHSLIVANLAEIAALDINANSALARVGAYYHDIGKLKYPIYFSENQTSENPHDSLDPYDSTKVIMQHVEYGLELADNNHLPRPVKDAIVQHHGTTVAKYFYTKAVNIYGNENVNEDDFRYKGTIPKSKEYAIIMLADTIEAAVRSKVSSGASMVEVEEFMKVLFKEKLDNGQLDDSSLTIKEMDTIRKSFMKVLKGMYHERVAYPEKIMNSKEIEEKEVKAQEDNDERGDNK